MIHGAFHKTNIYIFFLFIHLIPHSAIIWDGQTIKQYLLKILILFFVFCIKTAHNRVKDNILNKKTQNYVYLTL